MDTLRLDLTVEEACLIAIALISLMEGDERYSRQAIQLLNYMDEEVKKQKLGAHSQ